VSELQAGLEQGGQARPEKFLHSSLRQAASYFRVRLGHFLGEQSEEHVVPLFIALRIKLALGYQLSIQRDICVVRKVKG
jgi:hypothetical protein